MTIITVIVFLITSSQMISHYILLLLQLSICFVDVHAKQPLKKLLQQTLMV